MAIIWSLKDAGEVDVSFYNIDYFRPSWEDIRSYFAEGQFDVVGISAVVSTAYAFTKELARQVRSILPDAQIVVGGGQALAHGAT